MGEPESSPDVPCAGAVLVWKLTELRQQRCPGTVKTGSDPGRGQIPAEKGERPRAGTDPAKKDTARVRPDPVAHNYIIIECHFFPRNCPS